MLLELHEDQVPDLDEAFLASVGGAAVGAEVGTPVPEDLGAGSTRPGVGHSPVVVLVEALDAFDGHADLVAPDGLGLIVTDVDGHPESVGVEAQDIGHELPGEGAGVGLEVVAEAEVAHHLEEGEVATGSADLVEVVVLAAGPHALLDGYRPVPWGWLFSHEVGLEGDHSSYREQQRGVVWDQATGGLMVVAPVDEVVDECAPYAVG